MTDKTQPKALALADELRQLMSPDVIKLWAAEAAGMIRRQHARIAELEAARFAYASEFEPNSDGYPDVGSIHANIRALKAKLASIGAGGVQALSAAPEAIAKLRHLYQNMVNGAVRDTASAKRIAEGLLAPAIEALERATPPAEQPQPHYSHLHDADAVHGKRLSVYSKPTAEQQAAPKAAPGVGNSGFDHKTAADFLSGKTISDEAVRKFVQASRWAHDEKASLSAMLISVRGELASREAEIALLKKALLEAEAAPQQEAQEPCPTCAALARTVMLDQVSFDRKPDCYGIRQITDDEGVEEWEDIRTSPDVAREEANDMMATGRGEIYEVVPLWTTPQPSLTAKAADSVLEDAERLDWLALAGPVSICVVIDRPHDGEVEVSTDDVTGYGKTLREAIDAALAAQGGK